MAHVVPQDLKTALKGKNMDMQLIVTIVTSATAVVFAALYLKEVWSRSTDTSHRDIYDGLRNAHDCIDREVSRLNQELATLKEQQHRNTNTGCCKDYFSDNYKPAKTTKTTR